MIIFRTRRSELRVATASILTALVLWASIPASASAGRAENLVDEQQALRFHADNGYNLAAGYGQTQAGTPSAYFDVESPSGKLMRTRISKIGTHQGFAIRIADEVTVLVPSNPEEAIVVHDGVESRLSRSGGTAMAMQRALEEGRSHDEVMDILWSSPEGLLLERLAGLYSPEFFERAARADISFLQPASDTCAFHVTACALAVGATALAVAAFITACAIVATPALPGCVAALLGLQFSKLGIYFGCIGLSDACGDQGLDTPPDVCDNHDENGQCTPILLDLDRNQFHLSGVPVPFDIDADGVDEMVNWTRADQKDGFLVFDWNANRLVDDGAELFGSATPVPGGGTASNGYLALGVFDKPEFGGNGDSMISADDAIYPLLGIWLDSDHDGSSAREGEMQSLESMGVVAIDLDYRESGRVDEFGNRHSFRSRAWIEENGRRIKIHTVDVLLKDHGPVPTSI